MTSLFTGMATGLSLIVAIGAQNAFVLRQGLRRDRIGLVIAICALSDITLILAGVAGIGTLIEHAPALVEAIRWGGVAFLAWYAIAALRRAWTPGSLEPTGAPLTSGRTVVLTTLALTWLNPHVYLDTVVLLGSIATTHGPEGRWLFALGAALASLLWFSALGYGARLAAPLLARPSAWRMLDLAIGIGIAGLALALALAPGPHEAGH